MAGERRVRKGERGNAVLEDVGEGEEAAWARVDFAQFDDGRGIFAVAVFGAWGDVEEDADSIMLILKRY